MQETHPASKLHLEELWRQIMLIENILFPKEPVEQGDQEEDIGRVRRVDDIEAVPAPYLQAEQKGHEQRDAIFSQIGEIPVTYGWKCVAVDKDPIDTCGGLAVGVLSFRADDAHLKTVFAQGEGFRPDPSVPGGGDVFYEHEYFTGFCHELYPFTF